MGITPNPALLEDLRSGKVRFVGQSLASRTRAVAPGGDFGALANVPSGFIPHGGNGICSIYSNVAKTIINHPFGNCFYHLFMVMTGGWFMIVLPTLDAHLVRTFPS